MAAEAITGDERATPAPSPRESPDHAPPTSRTDSVGDAASVDHMDAVARGIHREREFARQGIYAVYAVVGLFAALTFVPLVNAVLVSHPQITWVTIFGGLELAVLAGFVPWVHTRRAEFERPAQRLRVDAVLWLALMAFPLSGMVAFSPEATYAAFALYFLSLWLLPAWIGALTVIATAALVFAGQAQHHGVTFGAFVGPVVSGFVAISVMFAIRALIASSERNAELVDRLTATQRDLADREREAGRLTERARLGRELHDTVAQHLSSISMFVDAALDVDDRQRAVEHLDRAMLAAADALAQTRAFIRDLTPPQLDGTSLANAIERLADEAREPQPGMSTTTATMTLTGEPRPAPMAVEAALLRVAQEAIANARRHGGATEVDVELSYGPDEITLLVADNGTGFDAEAWLTQPREPRRDGSGYGLFGMRDRLAQLGGSAVVVAEPGEGALVRATVPALAIDTTESDSDAVPVSAADTDSWPNAAPPASPTPATDAPQEEQ